jgi:HlyD family secretion protein
VKVAGQGILFDPGVLMDVMSGSTGRIVELQLVPGTEIRAGDVIARLGRPELQLDIDKTRADIADARNRLLEIENFQEESDRREGLAEASRLQSIETSQSHVRRRVALLEEKITSVQSLLQRKLLVRDRLIETELELATARERVAQLDDEIKLIEMKRLERQSRNRLTLLEERLKLAELERRLLRLEAQLAQEESIVSPHSGRVAEVKIAVGDVVTNGAPLATLIRTGEFERNAVALIYVSARDGRRIREGMPVEIVPTTAKKEEFGFIIGEVEDVSDVAATLEGMRSVLKNEQLAARLAGDGAPIAVRVRLARDPEAPSRLRWSSSNGPPHPIPSGTLLDAAVVVERIPILSLLAPGLGSLAGAEER